MTKSWLFVSAVALVIGISLAWRLWCFRDHPELRRFFFVFSFGWAIWLIFGLCCLDGAVRSGFLAATGALYSPALLVVAWKSMRRRS